VTHTVFVVEDEPNTRELYSFWLSEAGLAHKVFATAEACLKALSGFEPSVILLDLGLPGVSGMEALDLIHQARPKVPLVVMTADSHARTGIQAIHQGATDYLVKPIDGDEFEAVVHNAIQRFELEMELRDLRSQMIQEKRIHGLVGQSAAIQKVASKMGLVLQNSVPVFLEGETGTGKELVAKTIHENSDVSSGPFVPVNCGAIPKDLQESQFFGHEKGAFTGADRARAGFFEQADGGTIFLDEIGELTTEAQVKLLRVLQEQTVRRVGANQEKPLSVRVISATNKNLRAMIAEGTFREDLFYRLVVFPITIPPLRERLGDTPLLVGHFLRQYSETMGLALPEITGGALSALAAYSWPGNVRELQNAVQFTLLACKGEPIETEHLPDEISGLSSGEVLLSSEDSVSLRSPVTGDVKSLEDLELEIFIKVRDMANGNVTQAAQMLGVGRATFYRKLQSLNPLN